MSFIDKRLPLRLAAGLQIGPTWRTDVLEMENGREQRNRVWVHPRWIALGSMGAFNPADRLAMRNWFVAVAGKHMGFRVRDPLDYAVTHEVIAPAIGSSAPVQLVRSYEIEGTGVSVPVLVQAPVAGTVVVFRNGVPVSVTVDYATGLVTPDANWAAGDYTWSGEFDHWMRFNSDNGLVTAIAMNAYTADIELIEVRR